jgi:hypothetical protein
MDSNNTPISYWAFPGMAETKSVIQSTGSHLIPAPTRVIAECQRLFEVTEDEFWSKSRIQRIVYARRYAAFILFHFCGWNFVRMASLLKKDRTSLMHHVKQLRGLMENYTEERNNVRQLLSNLGMLNESSSGSDWYDTWVDEQLKSESTYLNILQKDTVEVLNEMIEITQADGRGNNFRLQAGQDDKVRKIRQAWQLIPNGMRMSTVKDAWEAKFKATPDLEAYQNKMAEQRGDRAKLAEPTVNVLDKY